MNITGKLTQILSLENGTTKAGKDWQKQSFVIEYKDGNFSKNVCINVKSETMIGILKQFNIGDSLLCEINIESREWQGKFFTDISAWKINKLNEDNLSF